MLKSKGEEERHIKEERDEMATEAFEHWLVSHTSMFEAFESVFAEHFNIANVILLLNILKYSNFVFNTPIFYVLTFLQTQKCLEKEKKRRNVNRPWKPPSKTIPH